MVRTASRLALLALQPAAFAAELSVTVELPRIEVAEYHRPYIAVWIEREDQTVAANLTVWYDVAGRDGAHWLADLRQWWRRSGRTLELPIDAVTGATRPAGQHDLTFTSGREPLGNLEAGNYVLVVEAARESGGREAARVPFEWHPGAQHGATTSGSAELGSVTVTIRP
jgi:hypothetical protein